MTGACQAGDGQEEGGKAQRRLVAGGPDGFLAGIFDKPLADIDEWQTEMQPH